MSAPARILLADDHALVRRGVRMILEDQPDLVVVAEAGDGAEAVAVLRETPVDLVVMDVAMPRMTGLQAAREISRRPDPPTLLMLSMHDNEQYFFESLRVGASGYVLKSVADRDLVDMVSVWTDGTERRAAGFQVVGYPAARGSAAAYFPEANVLVPLDSVAHTSNMPTSKGVYVRLEPATTQG